MPSRGGSQIDGIGTRASAAPVLDTPTTPRACRECGAPATGFRGPDAFCETHMPEDD
jgi:hypothetical protein